MKKNYTISIFTENTVGIFNRIAVVFTRRRVNIESITVSASEIPNVHRYTIVVKTDKVRVEKVVAQILKLVDVIKAFVNEDAELIHQEIALYKIRMNGANSEEIEKIINEHFARILIASTDYMVIEKTGSIDTIQNLFTQLKPYGILEFASSGRVALIRHKYDLSSYLKSLE